MILLIGGTSETGPIALALAEAGYPVLVSTATDELLHIGDHPNIGRRIGPLNREDMAAVAARLSVRVIVDASHPYASAARSNARHVAERLAIPYLTWVRPVALEEDRIDGVTSMHYAEDHTAAARLACSFARPVLLTTGSRNVSPYVREASRAGVRLVARVLPRADSVESCRRSGVLVENIVTGRGPFSIEQNIDLIQRFSIGVVVTKDSGAAGGVPQKIEAARRTGCRIVVIRRPEQAREATFAGFAELIRAVSAVWPI